VKVEATLHGDRKVYSVSAFNRGIGTWLARLPTLWVEGEITELRRQDGWQSVFFTLKDIEDGSCLPASMPRATFDALGLEVGDGDKVHVYGRPELYEARGVFQLRALSLEPLGLGAALARIERLKRTLAAEGLFAAERKRPLPLLPRRIGLLTGNEAAAKRDFLTAVAARFPAARVLVAETLVQGAKAPASIAAALAGLAAEPGVDVVVVARGGGSFEDLLPFSDESVVRAVATSGVPIVSAVGHEQDTPLCDLAADARAATPTAAGALVVPHIGDLGLALDASRRRLGLAVRAQLERDHGRLVRQGERLRSSPRLLLERRRAALDRSGARLQALSPLATLNRGYAIVRLGGGALRTAAEAHPGDRLHIQLAVGSLDAHVDEAHA
jgi:exodeoxyribonuclease VII large subunit